jgi:ABC-type transport system involved in multi-copper enzyme maturation permease subunit
MIEVFTSRAPSLTMTLLKRELLTGLRSWKIFLLLLALLGLLYSTAFYAMNAASMNYIFMSGAMRSLFSMQVFAMGTLVFAVIPALSAVSINGERQDKNYDLLLTTLITPRRIVLGKFAAVLIRALLVATAVLPFTGLVYFYAGVDVGSFFNALAVLLPAALCNTAIGLWCSSRFDQPTQSISASFFLVAAVSTVVPMALYWFTPLRSLPILGPVLLGFSKSPAMFSLIYASFQLVTCAALLATMLFGKASRPCPPEPGRKPLKKSRAAKPSPTLDTNAYTFVPIPDHVNPLRFKDVRGTADRTGKVSRDVFYIVAITYILVTISISDRAIYMSVLERLCILVLVPPIIATIMVKDREETTFDMLRMTLLDGGDLVLGKIAVLFRLLKVELCAVLLCKTCIAVLHLSGTFPEQSGTPGYFYVIDLAFLPLHFLFIVLAAMLGTAMTRRLMPAIAGASGITLSATCVVFFLQRSIGRLSAPSALVFAVSHTLIIGLFCIVLFATVSFLYSRLWRATR